MVVVRVTALVRWLCRRGKWKLRGKASGGHWSPCGEGILPSCTESDDSARTGKQESRARSSRCFLVLTSILTPQAGCLSESRARRERPLAPLMDLHAKKESEKSRGLSC